jgi:osmotically-inducible protein OsmY
MDSLRALEIAGTSQHFFRKHKKKEPRKNAVPFYSMSPSDTHEKEINDSKITMKQIILSFLCLSALSVCVIAQENNAAVDNTAKNQRDRSGETATSGDQSNNSQDVQTTAAIRKAVVGDDSLSAAAKNVKIIFDGQTVTLRGPVNTADEKTKIEQLAQSAASNVKIDNQLEVKASQ